MGKIVDICKGNSNPLCFACVYSLKHVLQGCNPRLIESSHTERKIELDSVNHTVE